MNVPGDILYSLTHENSQILFCGRITKQLLSFPFLVFLLLWPNRHDLNIEDSPINACQVMKITFDITAEILLWTHIGAVCC